MIEGTVDSVDATGNWVIVTLKEYPGQRFRKHLLHEPLDWAPKIGQHARLNVDTDDRITGVLFEGSEASRAAPVIPRTSELSSHSLVSATQTPTKLRVSEGRIEFLPLKQLVESSWNPNEMDDETFAALIQDMRQGGLYTINPIQVFPIAPTESGEHRYQIADGHHRFRAAKRIPVDRIRAEVLFETTEAEAKVINYRKNHEHGKLNPLKEAELFFGDWEKGKGSLTQEEIAKKYLVSQAHVSERLGLLGMPASVKEAVKTGELPSTHAEAIYRSAINPEAQEIVGKVAVKEKLSPDQTTTLVHAVSKQLQATPNIRPKVLREETTKIAKNLKKIRPELKATRPEEVADIIRGARSQSVEEFASGSCPWCGKPLRWIGGHKFAKGK